MLAFEVLNTEVENAVNFAILIGAFIGLATAGPFSDWVSARATKKNNGIREPEMRLPAMSTLQPLFATPFSKTNASDFQSPTSSS